MKKEILAILLATTIVAGYLPITVKAEAKINDNITLVNMVENNYENGIYTVNQETPNPENETNPNPGEEGTEKPEDENVINEGYYTIENDVLKIDLEEESSARKYVNNISDIESKDERLYLTLKFTGKSMMSNHVIKIDGNETEFEVIDESNDNFMVKFEINSLSDDIVVSTTVLGTMKVEFRVKLKVDTLSALESTEDDSDENMDEDKSPEVTPEEEKPQPPVTNPIEPNKPTIEPPKVEENTNTTIYKVQNEILTDSEIGYNAARAAVNSISYIEEIEGIKYATIGLSQTDIMTNIRVAIDGSQVQYEVVRKDDSNNTMDIRFRIPSMESSLIISTYITASGMDISFGIDFLENTMEVISKEEATAPLAKPVTTTVNTDESKDKTEEKESKEENIEAKEYFKRYTIENEIISDSAMRRTMLKKYLDNVSILEEVDGKLYLTLKFSSADAMDNIKFIVNGQEVEYSVLDTTENGVKAYRFIINDISDEILVYLHVKPIKKDIDFGIKLLAETKMLIEEGIVAKDESVDNNIVQGATNNEKVETSVPKIILGTAASTALIIFGVEGIIFGIIKKRRKKL